MNNVEFNNAAIHMGYRYLGKTAKDGETEYIWAKPLGNVCTRLIVMPNMENITMQCLCWVYENHQDKDIKPAIFAVKSIKSMNNPIKDICPDVDIHELAYNDFINYIIDAECELNVQSAINLNRYASKNYAFKQTMDQSEMLQIKYGE